MPTLRQEGETTSSTSLLCAIHVSGGKTTFNNDNSDSVSVTLSSPNEEGQDGFVKEDLVHDVLLWRRLKPLRNRRFLSLPTDEEEILLAQLLEKFQ